MFEPPLDLARARILLSNDDGIEASGLKTLERIARSLSKDIWVVAPATEQSAASHSLTLRVPLRIRKLGPRRFAVDGTPTDAVLLAVQHIMSERRPDLVLSGVNRGGNLGEDVTYSGTIAAAMEGTLLGVPSIALSQCMVHGRRTRWATAEQHAEAVIRKLVAIRWPKGVLMNVNFPDVPGDEVTGIEAAALGRRKIGGELERRLDPRGTPYYWISTMRTEDPALKGSDLAAVNAGAIAVTPLFLDLTHRPTIRSLEAVLA